MAAKPQRLLDVWIVESNQVYTGVPFTVVADWLQQGRLLAADRVRVAGNQKWHGIAAVGALAPYLPRTEPAQATDAAEALEAVDLDVGWGRRHDDEDDDVDMIPLIDISLVLLIFFMMTATVSSGVFSTIQTPAAEHQLDEIAHDTYWLGIDVQSRGGTTEKDVKGRPQPWFSLGKNQDDQLVEPTRDLAEVLAAFRKELAPRPGGDVKVRLKAERSLPIETVRGATLDLQDVERRLNRERGKDKAKFRLEILGEVSEPKK